MQYINFRPCGFVCWYAVADPAVLKGISTVAIVPLLLQGRKCMQLCIPIFASSYF